MEGGRDGRKFVTAGIKFVTAGIKWVTACRKLVGGDGGAGGRGDGGPTGGAGGAGPTGGPTGTGLSEDPPEFAPVMDEIIPATSVDGVSIACN